jgi:hypothetical protein
MTGFAADVAAVLMDDPDGLATRDLCVALQDRSINYAFLKPEQADRLLARHPDVFMHGANDCWVLVRMAARHAVMASLEGNIRTIPKGMRTRGDIVVFDIEATSTKPEHAEILQIAAVRLDADLREIARSAPAPSSPQAWSSAVGRQSLPQMMTPAHHWFLADICRSSNMQAIGASLACRPLAFPPLQVRMVNSPSSGRCLGSVSCSRSICTWLTIQRVVTWLSGGRRCYRWDPCGYKTRSHHPRDEGLSALAAQRRQERRLDIGRSDALAYDGGPEDHRRRGNERLLQGDDI